MSEKTEKRLSVFKKDVPLHKIGCTSAIKRAYGLRFALPLHKIGCTSAIKRAYGLQFGLSILL